MTENIDDLANKYYKLLKPEDYKWAMQSVYPIWFELLLDMTLGFGIERVSVMQLIQHKINNERKHAKN